MGKVKISYTVTFLIIHICTELSFELKEPEPHRVTALAPSAILFLNMNYLILNVNLQGKKSTLADLRNSSPLFFLLVR
jgi:hypothetical protein